MNGILKSYSQFINCVSFALIVIISSAGSAYGQKTTSFTIDKDTIEIGDIVILNFTLASDLNSSACKLTLKSYLSIPNLIYTQDTTLLEPLADIALFSSESSDDLDLNSSLPLSSWTKQSQNGMDHYSLQFSIYNPGVYQLPTPLIVCNADTLTNKDRTKNIKTLFVKMPAALMTKDSLSLNPIHDIIKEPTTWVDYLLYLYILLGLVIMYLIYRYFKRRPTKKVVLDVAEVIIPPHIKAVKALNKLKAMNLWESGQTKEYQSQLTTIIRTYLEERYRVSANEMTTSEIREAMNPLLTEVALQHDLVQILSIADLIKFAKAKPEESVHATFMNMAINFVDKTKDDHE